MTRPYTWDFGVDTHTAWMGLLAGDRELDAQSYKRLRVDPLRTGADGRFEISGTFLPVEGWDGLTAVALWATCEGGTAFYRKTFDPVRVEPGHKISFTLRIRDLSDDGWRSLIRRAWAS